jgi:hypothetical protein
MILNQANLHIFFEDLAVSATCVISTSLFRVTILLVAAGSQKCHFGILKFTPRFFKALLLLQQFKFWDTQADAQGMMISVSAYHVPS